MKRLFIYAILALCCAPHLHALTLPAALERTLENNPAIQQSKTGLEEAVGRRLILRAVALPDAGVRGPAGVLGGKRTETSSSTQAFGFVQGNFAQPLFNAAILASYRRGDLELLIAEQQLNLTVVEQLHKTRIAFYTALYNRKKISAARKRVFRPARPIALRWSQLECKRVSSILKLRMRIERTAPRFCI
jgi:outer membrane protein TolC